MCDPATRPTFIPVLNAAKVVMHYQLDLQECQNVFYFDIGHVPDATDCMDLCNNVITAWIARFQSLQPTALQLLTVEATSLSGAVAPFARVRVNDFGEGGSAALPNNVTLSIKFDGDLTGRSTRGRMYWLQLQEDQVVGSFVQTTPLGQILGAVEGFFEDIAASSSNATHIVVSYCGNGDWRMEGLKTVVTNYSSDGIPDSQRRRLPGRGR